MHHSASSDNSPTIMVGPEEEYFSLFLLSYRIAPGTRQLASSAFQYPASDAAETGFLGFLRRHSHNNLYPSIRGPLSCACWQQIDISAFKSISKMSPGEWR
jgi:hypothetical protein